jgi:hypothetical protein
MLHAGYLRTPTSCELLIATPNLDFIDRAQIVRTLAANRPVGLQADRAVAGVGVRVTHGPFLFFAEAMWVALDSSDVPDQEIWGYQGGAGWTINRLIQTLARYDSLHGEGAVSDLDLAIGSLVLNFTDDVNPQAETRVPHSRRRTGAGRRRKPEHPVPGAPT